MELHFSLFTISRMHGVPGALKMSHFQISISSSSYLDGIDELFSNLLLFCIQLLGNENPWVVHFHQYMLIKWSSGMSKQLPIRNRQKCTFVTFSVSPVFIMLFLNSWFKKFRTKKIVILFYKPPSNDKSSHNKVFINSFHWNLNLALRSNFFPDSCTHYCIL